MFRLRGNGVLGDEFSPGGGRTFDGAYTNARPSILPFYHDVADECDCAASRMSQAVLNEFQQDASGFHDATQWREFMRRRSSIIATCFNKSLIPVTLVQNQHGKKGVERVT